jgi:hypothetical protein
MRTEKTARPDAINNRGDNFRFKPAERLSGAEAPRNMEKLGYQLAWQLDDFPPGHRNSFLVKRFLETAASPAASIPGDVP